jgi:hypothetical protein
MKYIKKFRLLKESISQEDINNDLIYLLDDGFKILKLPDSIQIFKQKEYKEYNSMDNLIELNWFDIESDLLPFIEKNEKFIIDVILVYSKIAYSGVDLYDRQTFSVNEILEGDIGDIGKIIKVTIRFTHL